jgi:hypothetical protein
MISLPNSPCFDMVCFANRLALIGLAACIGCGPGPKVAEKPSAATETSAARTAPRGPTDVVSQFLDEVRRGGKDSNSNANALLTERARSELSRIGRSVQPIGSPDAAFVVTRAELLPGEQDVALVHSIWSEPNRDDTVSDFQVVWAVRREAGQWRISGLAMEVVPDQDPVIVDFENGELMAKLLANPEPVNPGEPNTQAAAPNTPMWR